ncbi:MAG: alpha/beta hydrolase [Anaerovoracaceae bacterium]|jgi:predicted alpha/beta superfamily hydrolase
MTDQGKKISAYPGPAGSPIVYLNTFMEEESEKVRACLEQEPCPAHTLVTVSGIDWNDEMTPWYSAPLSKRDTACGGKADSYITWMEQELSPSIEGKLSEPPAYRIIAGYSLAGLFAAYSLYQTTLFRRAACMSGSFWYPDFLEFAESHELRQQPEFVYFSLGDKESRTRHPLMKQVGDRTQALAQVFQKKGIPTVFEWNPGNHFRDVELRTAKGIRRALQGA